MIVENLSINRVVMHEVFQRKDSPKIVPPSYGKELETLDAKALSHFGRRITDAFSAQSKSIEMQIVKTDDASVIGVARRLVLAADNDFPTISNHVADALADAQKSRGIPGGMLLVFDGKVGSDEKPFVGVIKAEMQSGFQRRQDMAKVVTEFLENIFLTPATRLYKLSLFISGDEIVTNDTQWRCFVFDSNITSARPENAAVYFYDGFLGCTFPENGKYETAKFFDLTKEFVRSSVKDRDLRRDLSDALFAFVKVDQTPTFTSQQFGETYLPPELRDPFNKFLESKKFPTNRAVVRDLSEMSGRLRRRKYKFGPDIEFSVSPDAIRDGTATIEDLPAEDLAGGEARIWTRITIRRPVTEQL
ncbi:nucleoid-associated protein [Acetobacter papayae]|uniref:nucleoid-associated protein n=1 Tax=Acetobacter papayae TaxID=1076592 RepID=UPI000A7B4975|nr:nucleoid-associated protein [Acetobacter papayae]